MSSEPMLLSVLDAVRVSGLGRSKIYQELQASRIESVKVGRRRLIPVKALEDYIERLRQEARGEEATTDA